MPWLFSLYLLFGVPLFSMAQSVSQENSILPKGPLNQLSGQAFLSPSLRAIQNDPSTNPVSLWLEQGRVLWAGQASQASCAQCHGLIETMRQAATHFPLWSVKQQKVINLEDQILICSERTQRPFKGLENADVLSLSALLHQTSAGLSFQMAPKDEVKERWQLELNEGAKLFTTRMGRMNLACTHCHDLNIGKTMRSDVISPGHPTGFPIFKLSWQSMGSIDRRLRACYSGVQAEVPAPGSSELRQLELFLKSRAQGMPIEGPSLRR
jgi:sulfur-oxidizing protein SoxA